MIGSIPAGFCMKFDPRGGAQVVETVENRNLLMKEILALFHVCFYNHLSRVRQNIFGSFFVKIQTIDVKPNIFN